MKPALLAVLLFAFADSAISAGPEEPCAQINEQIAKACAKSPADKALGAKVSGHCVDFHTKVKTLDELLQKLQGECATAGAKVSKTGAKKGRGGQGLAPVDTSGVMTKNQELLDKCAGEMERIRNEYRGLSDTAVSETQSLGSSGASPACAAMAKEAYGALQKRADERYVQSEERTGQYRASAEEAKKAADANNKKANSMKTAGSDGAGKGAGEGGGAPKFPDLPQMPKKPPEKTPAQLLAEQKALRSAQCQNLAATFTGALNSCGSINNCEPEIARVKNVCDAYNKCLDDVPPVPLDCPIQFQLVKPPHK